MNNRTFAPRCATTGIHNALPQSMKLQLFEYIDQQVLSGIEMDYLQTFELTAKVIDGKPVQYIVHQQEVPERRQDHIINGIDAPLNLTVWIVDGDSHAIMLLPEEY